jgi:hypothetical protein
MKSGSAALAALCLVLALPPSSTSAQPASASSPHSQSAHASTPAVDEFGIQDGIDLWIPASQFRGDGTLAESHDGYPGCISDPDCTLYALLPLPQGAFLDSWRAFFYDNSSSSFYIRLSKIYDDTTADPIPGSVLMSEFTSSGTPGYTNHHQVENLTIDLREPSGPGVTRMEAADFYRFFVVLPHDGAVGFKGVRVFWHRQVSPAPATATFTDVPTDDPAFAYIEALSASGVTAGCNVSPPKYCPDDTLTRRQMAVFLAKALGLHWPAF